MLDPGQSRFDAHYRQSHPTVEGQMSLKWELFLWKTFSEGLTDSPIDLRP